MKHAVFAENIKRLTDAWAGGNLRQFVEAHWPHAECTKRYRWLRKLRCQGVPVPRKGSTVVADLKKLHQIYGLPWGALWEKDAADQQALDDEARLLITEFRRLLEEVSVFPAKAARLAEIKESLTAWRKRLPWPNDASKFLVRLFEERLDIHQHVLIEVYRGDVDTLVAQLQSHMDEHFPSNPDDLARQMIQRFEKEVASALPGREVLRPQGDCGDHQRTDRDGFPRAIHGSMLDHKPSQISVSPRR